MLKITENSELIAKFTKALKQIKNFNALKNHEAALKLINSTFLDLFRLNIPFLSSLYYADIIALNKKSGKLDAEKTLIMGVLLSEYETTNSNLTGDSNFFMIEKSLLLLLDAFDYNDGDKEFNDHFSYIPLVFEKIKDYDLSEETIYKSINYFKCIGNYSQCEDLLYELMDSNDYAKTYIEKSLGFYEDLLTKEDDILINGGLPREEILEAVSCLKKKL